MNKVLHILKPPNIHDAEENRIAGIVNVLAVAAFIGLTAVFVNRIAAGQTAFFVPMLGMWVVSGTCFILLRKGYRSWAAGLILWMFLAALCILAWRNNGVHDSAILALPGVLVIASLVLKKPLYVTLTAVALIFVSIVGYLEIQGVLLNDFSARTTSVNIIDVVVILSVTGITAWVISENLLRTSLHARDTEREAGMRLEQLKESGERYRALFEGANDAIFIIKEEQFVECNATTLTMFRCTRSSDILGHSPWELSPPVQPDGINSRDSALRFINLAYQGAPQRFYWKHARTDGTVFDTEVLLSSVELGSGRYLQALVRDISDQKRSEEALRRNEELYRKLVSTVPDIIIRTGLEGNIVYINETRFPGWESVPSGEILEKNILSFVAEEDRGRAIENTRLMFEKALGPKEYKVSLEPGVVLECEVNGDVLRDVDGTPFGMVYVVRDITERKRAEQRLQESEERYRRLVELSPEAVAVHSEGKFVYLNPAAVALIGAHDASEVVGRPILDVVHPDYRVSVIQRVTQAVKDRTSQPLVDEQFIRMDGGVIDVEVTSIAIVFDGKPAVLAMVHDITERKRAERALERSEERFKQIADSADEWIWEVDADGVYRYCSSSVERILGFSPEELTGKKKFFELFPPDVREELKEQALNAFARREVIKKFVNPNVHKDGSIVFLETNGLPVLDEQGNLLGYRGADTNITERRRSEELILASLQEKELLLKEIHHRVKNNMQVVTSLLSLEINDIADERTKERFRESINRIRSMALVHEKLYRSENMAGIDFGDYLGSVTGELMRGSNLRGVTCNVEAEKVFLGIDTAVPCGLLVNELVSNSLKHAFPSRDQGRIIVSLRRVNPETLQLTVRDDGVGLPAEKDVREMTSMGSTLIVGLVKQIGGTLEIERSSGTRIAVDFPG